MRAQNHFFHPLSHLCFMILGISIYTYLILHMYYNLSQIKSNHFIFSLVCQWHSKTYRSFTRWVMKIKSNQTWSKWNIFSQIFITLILQDSGYFLFQRLWMKAILQAYVTAFSIENIMRFLASSVSWKFCLQILYSNDNFQRLQGKSRSMLLWTFK